MSKLITNTLRHTAGSADNITLDSSQNVTVEGNLTVDGTTTLTGAVELPDDTVDIADLSASGTASSSTYLRGDNSWAAVSSVGGATGVDFNDDVKVRFGSDQDLDVWHDGDDGQVDLSTGYLKIRDVTNSRDIAKFHSSNSQEFYMNGTKRMEVTNTGISVTGSVTPSGGIYLGGSGGSNYLADYEKGSWDATCDNSVTLHDAELFYTKVGRLVHVCGYLRVNSDNSNAAFVVNNLPFTANNGYGLSAPCMRLNNWNLDSDCMWVAGYTDANKIYFQQVKDDAQVAALAADSGAVMILNLSYYEN